MLYAILCVNMRANDPQNSQMDANFYLDKQLSLILLRILFYPIEMSS